MSTSAVATTTTLDPPNLSKTAIAAAKSSPMMSSTLVTMSAIESAGEAMANETVAEVAAEIEAMVVMLAAAAVALMRMIDETRGELGVGTSEAAASEVARLPIVRRIVPPVVEKEHVPIVVVDRSITIR